MKGRLAAFADGWRRDLVGQEYALDTICDRVHLLADLSDWLESQGWTPLISPGRWRRSSCVFAGRRVPGLVSHTARNL